MILALTIGLFGSLHCIGMCGPLTLLMTRSSWSGFVLYHFARLVTYMLIGLVFGWIGYSLQLFKIQQIATIVIGLLLIVLYGIPSVKSRMEQFYYHSKIYKAIVKLSGKGTSEWSNTLMRGVANGLLPCGLTYIAAAGAVAKTNPVEGILFMGMFGLGTLPALALVKVIQNIPIKNLSKIIPRSTTLIGLLSGFVLVLRGWTVAFPDFNELVQANVRSFITVCGLE